MHKSFLFKVTLTIFFDTFLFWLCFPFVLFFSFSYFLILFDCLFLAFIFLVIFWKILMKNIFCHLAFLLRHNWEISSAPIILMQARSQELFRAGQGFYKSGCKFLAIIWDKFTWKHMNNSSKYTYTTTQFNDKENHQKYKYFYHEKKRYIFFVILYQWWANFFLGARLFGRAILLVRPLWHVNSGCSKLKCASDRDTIRSIGFCSLLP